MHGPLMHFRGVHQLEADAFFPPLSAESRGEPMDLIASQAQERLEG